MSEIKSNFGSGGANLSPAGSSGEPSLAEALRDIADDLAALLAHGGTAALRGGGVIPFPLLGAPSTGSSQLTGAGNTTWNVNIAAYVSVVGGVTKEFAAAADFSIHASSFLAGFINGTSCIAAIVAKNVSGTITTVAVKGTPATTGSEVAPTDAEIQTALGATVPWVKVGECTLERDGDTSVVETQDNGKMEPAMAPGYTIATTKG